MTPKPNKPFNDMTAETLERIQNSRWSMSDRQIFGNDPEWRDAQRRPSKLVQLFVYSLIGLGAAILLHVSGVLR